MLLKKKDEGTTFSFYTVFSSNVQLLFFVLLRSGGQLSISIE